MPERGFTSRPAIETGWLNVIVSDWTPGPVSSTLGVALAVSGGDPQVGHVAGTVRVTTLDENVAVTVPSLIDVLETPSAPVMGIRCVVEKYAAAG